MEQSLKGHFLSLYHMALSDSEIDIRELEMIYKIGNERGISKSELEDVVLHPEAAILTPPVTVLEKIESLYDFARIALADGTIDQSERRLLEIFSKRYNFQDENIPALVEFLLNEAKNGTSKEQIFKIVTENL